MSVKKGRGAKVLTVQQDDSQKATPFDHSELSSMSTIDKVSFLEGLQLNNRSPLHSTAMEDDLNVLKEAQVDKGKAGRKGIPQMLKNTPKQHGAVAKRKQKEKDGEIEKEEEKRKRSRSTGETVKGRRPEKGRVTKKRKAEIKGVGAELDVEKVSDVNSSSQKSNAPTASNLKGLVGKKPAKRRSAGQKAVVRPEKNKQMKKNKTKTKLGSGRSSDPQSQEESESGTTHQRRNKVLSFEEEVDEDTGWNPSPKKTKAYSLGRARKSWSNRSKSRKSSSGSASADTDNTIERKKRRGDRGVTNLEVVLDAFLEFCDQYRESVESKGVKQSIDSFSNNVKDQLLEKVSSYKELRVLKRENAKVGTLIRKKTQRLLDAKHELMRAERQVWLLQKEKAELELRLADLRQGHAFLRDIRAFNRQYLDYRDKHPKEKETYGASSLPALLLETKHVLTAEHQLRGINNLLEKKLKNDGAEK